MCLFEYTFFVIKKDILLHNQDYEGAAAVMRLLLLVYAHFPVNYGQRG